MEEIKKVIDKILKYWLLLTVFVYIVGYIYVQGQFMFISPKILPLNPFGITASMELYVKNGINFLLIIIMPLVLSVFTFEFIKLKLKFNKNMLSFMPGLIIIQFVSWAIHFWVSTRSKNNFITIEVYEVFNFLYTVIYYFITLTVFIICFNLISELTREQKNVGFINNNLDNIEYKKTKASIYLYHTLMMSFSIIISIYCSGFFKQDILIQSAINNNGGKITYADVITEDASKRYLYFDIVNNNFIGFDINYSSDSSSSVIIPLSKVKKIDIVELSSPIKVKVLSKDINVVARKKVVEDFYASYKKKDPDAFINLISRKMYKEHPYSLIPADELKKIWDQNIDFDSSIPIYFQVFEGIENK